MNLQLLLCLIIMVALDHFNALPQPMCSLNDCGGALKLDDGHAFSFLVGYYRKLCLKNTYFLPKKLRVETLFSADGQNIK